jgi:hypothetical protein
VIEEFARDMQTRSEQASGLHAGTLGKARGHALRLSCVLARLRRCATKAAEPTVISAEAATAAAALVDRGFLPMAERAFGVRLSPHQRGGQWLTLQICSGLPRDAAHRMNVSERMVYSRPYSGAALVGPLGADCDGPVAG